MRVWTNGCFDLLHIGHIELFKYAKTLGHELIVGIDTDARVRTAKGPQRPINPCEDRKQMLEAIRHIDKVVVFDDDDSLREAIRDNDIQTLVVGSDWIGKRVIGAELVTQVIFFDRIGDYSTTQLIEKIDNDLRI
tara:strand:+ start:1183 stop:1587 length:405 start_codon:yes stop_codon:yes gene_type:complete